MEVDTILTFSNQKHAVQMFEKAPQLVQENTNKSGKPRFSFSRIGVRLPMIMCSLVTVTILVMVVSNFFLTERIVERAASAKLEGAGTLKGKQIKGLLDNIDRDLKLRASDPATKNALIALADGFQSLENPTEVLQRVYIEENKYPVGQKDLLISADTGSSYGFIHTVYHPVLNDLLNTMGYYDVFLFDPEGNLVYSAFKENDFATNMLQGKWKESGLAEAFRGANAAGAADAAYFVDFAPYAPSNGAPAAFIARPVFNDQGERLGVLAYQMPIGQLNEVVGDQVGLGETADGFLVGSDFLLRTDSVMTPEDDTLKTSYDTEAVQEGLSGGSGLMQYQEPSGRYVMAYYSPIDFHGTRWVKILQQDHSEIFSGLPWAMTRALGIAVAVLLVVLAVSLFVSRSFSRPIQKLSDAVRRVADGEFDIDVPGTNRTDELGELARATEIFRQNSIKIKELNAEQEAASKEMAAMAAERAQAAHRAVEAAKEKEEADLKAAQDREAMMIDLGQSFGTVVTAALEGEFSKRVDAKFSDKILNELAENINQLMGAVDDGLSKTGQVLERVANGDLTHGMEGDFKGAFASLQGNVNEMMGGLKTLIREIAGSGITLASSSSELRDTSNALTERTEQNAASLEETSAALEEISASIQQVSRNATDASENTQSARDKAQYSQNAAAEATASINSIASASQEITRVVGVIDDIAFQINLLALNAGVEAARAGDAGRGFSVVASEVRQLAQRASEASKEIAMVIKKSDTAVSEGVEKVAGAQTSLEAIAQSVIGISSRVDDISSAIKEQVIVIDEITAAVGQIDRNTQQQTASFEEVTAAAAMLASEADNLKQSTARFKTGKDVNVVSMREPATPTVPWTQTFKAAAASGGGGQTGWEEF